MESKRFSPKLSSSSIFIVLFDVDGEAIIAVPYQFALDQTTFHID